MRDLAVLVSLQLMVGVVIGMTAVNHATIARLLDALQRRTDEIRERVDGIKSPTLNPYAHLLGRVVEAQRYEGGEWSQYVVVAVGWHGSMCLRSLTEPTRNGFWLHRWEADRVREIDARHLGGHDVEGE